MKVPLLTWLGAEQLIKNWLCNQYICYSSIFSNDFVLLGGKATIPKKYLNRKVEYKYVALKEYQNEVEFWEVLFTANTLLSALEYKRNRILEISDGILEKSKDDLTFCTLFLDKMGSYKIATPSQ